jgi:hypothetical protein
VRLVVTKVRSYPGATPHQLGGLGQVASTPQASLSSLI